MVGMMGAGKTAVGQALARMLAVPFLDSDAEIVAASTLTIPEIFERHGEAFFREKEAQVIARLLSDRPTVLSTGGGAWMSATNRATIASRGVSVWLRAEVALLWSRVRHKPTRPLLRTPHPLGTLTRLSADRAPTYALADITVDTRSDYSVERTAGRVLDALIDRPDVVVPR